MSERIRRIQRGPVRIVFIAAATMLAIVACGSVDNSAVDASPPITSDSSPPPEPDAAMDAPPEPVDAPLTGKSCRDLHDQDRALPPGIYSIDPDGGDPEPAIDVYCDMKTDGGGWTIVFIAAEIDYRSVPATNPIGYTVASRALLKNASQTLLAFRHESQEAYPNYASLQLPANWRTKPPFQWEAVNEPVQVSVNAEAQTAGTLHYGHATWEGQSCDDKWVAANGPWGRLCIEGTLAPFYSGFAQASASTTDFCTDSRSPHNTGTCGNDRRFTIAVR